ncbi:AraC family transcriptional regulator [Actinoplanes friuliensis]|jgi:AraC-like DNA-binding protein|uniref:AraC family transcriptional regulator n=1 Tax=Actinoplanes friuliensis DSM 7358 TaxID=1246995 RepID=U5VUY0_9ACTN|nr:AraC family transcriptional regulator [Actinoplanes friuliensis]AGZ40659.1 AraC family transcriptional regulator [Actinoplanes friuliensis DSM 7358]
MPLVLDTSLLPAAQRAEAVREAMTSSIAPASVAVAPPGHARIAHWVLGPGAEFLHHVSSGHRLTRTSRHLQSDNPERISLGLPVSGAVRMRHRDLPGGDRIGELQLVDLTSPYDFLVEETSTVQALIVDYSHLGVPVDSLRNAIPRLAASPMYELVRRHLLELPGVLDNLQPDPALTFLGSSTVELVRGLIASAADPDASWLRAASTGTLFTRVTEYIRQHQREPDLSAARLAAAHDVSVRTLYAAFAAENEQLGEWVIRGRLREAHRELAECPTATVASIARSWGFANARHFARRFRDEYGISPGEWQHGVSRPAVVTPATNSGR